MRDSALILFHSRPVVVSLSDGAAHDPETLRRFTRRGLGVLSASLAVFAVVLVWGYGRMLWSEAAWFGMETGRTVFAWRGNAPRTELASAYVAMPRADIVEPAPLPTGETPGETAKVLAPDTRPTASPAPASPAPAAATGPATPTPTPKPATPVPTRVSAAPQAAAPTEGTQPRTIGEMYIERIGIRVPVVLPVDPSSVKSANDALVKGVIIWPGSAPLASGGTTIVLGHSSAPLSYRGKYGAVFSLLEKLKPGDLVTVTALGAVYTYRMRDFLKINPKKEHADLMQQDGETLLLVSCWPVGTNWQRMVVRADRVTE